MTNHHDEERERENSVEAARIKALADEYEAEMHAVQTGVKIKQEVDPVKEDYKDLRVGINSAHVSDSALVAILLRKGIITKAELHEALVEAARKEKKMYEAHLSNILGEKVTLL